MIINIKFDKDLELNESIKITLEKEEKKNIESGLVEAGVVCVDEIKAAESKLNSVIEVDSEDVKIQGQKISINNKEVNPMGNITGIIIKGLGESINK